MDPTPSVVRLSELYIEKGIISASHRYDSAHIAIASVHELDFVVSYNFEHINRNKARIQTAIANHRAGYPSVIICTAREVLDNG